MLGIIYNQMKHKSQPILKLFQPHTIKLINPDQIITINIFVKTLFLLVNKCKDCEHLKPFNVEKFQFMVLSFSYELE